MGRVFASVQVDGQASAAEQLWYDVTRWAGFVEGFGHIERVSGEWPQAGSSVTWTSAPGGRGRVLEEVRRYEARVGQECAVEDERMRGTQRIGFEPNGDGVLVSLELVYEVKGQQPKFARAIFDLLFVRRPMRESVTKTLVRFRREFNAEREFSADA